MHHNPTRRCPQLDVGCAVGPTQRPCSKAHLAAVIVDDALLAILLNADAVPAYLPESSLPDPPSLTGPPCPLNDRNSQDSRLPSMVAGNSRSRSRLPTMEAIPAWLRSALPCWPPGRARARLSFALSPRNSIRLGVAIEPALVQARISFTTLPPTSVSRKSRPL